MKPLFSLNVNKTIDRFKNQKGIAMLRVWYVFLLFILFGSQLFAYSKTNTKTQQIVSITKEMPEPHFGLIVTNPDQETLKKYDLTGGAEVLKVFKHSEAEKAGLKEHDIIIKFDGESIDDCGDLQDYLFDLDERKDVDIVVNRNGKELIFTAHVEPLAPQEKELVLRLKAHELKAKADSIVQQLKTRLKDVPLINPKGGFLGVETETLNEQLAAYFGVEFGVLVQRVIKDSPAEKSGLKAGDVIYQINDKKIHDVADLMRTINYYDPGDRVKIYFKRKGKDRTVVVTLGKKEGLNALQWMPGYPKNFFPFGKFKGHYWYPQQEEEEEYDFDPKRPIYKF